LCAPHRDRHVEVVAQRGKRLDHVRVAQVPRRDSAAEHRPVVLLRVPHEASVLLGEELLVAREAAVARREVAHLNELRDSLVLARLARPERRSLRVRLRVGRMVEASVPLPRPRGRIRRNRFEIRNDCLDGRMQAVEVDAVEADAFGRAALRVRLPQPFDEVANDGVPPHPGGKAAEVSERLLRARVLRCAAHIAIDAVCIGPVRLDCDRADGSFLDQLRRERGPHVIELVGSVRRLAEKHVFLVARAREDRVERH
jgi:hypothetical protein